MTSACPSCGKKYTFPADAVGRDFACKQCGLTVLIQADGLRLVEQPPPMRRPKPERPIRADDQDDSDDGVPVRRRPEPVPSPVVDFITFRRPMSVRAIVRGYWIATALSVIAGGYTIYMSFHSPSVSFGGGGLSELLAGGGGGGMPMPTIKNEFSPLWFFAGVAQIVLVPALLRAGCEFVITILRIYHRLGEIKDALDRQATHPPSAAG